MRRFFSASLPLLFASLCACSYTRERVRDLSDIVRLEGHVGYGIKAHANAGELLHAGAGSGRQWSAGWVYGRGETNTSVEHHFPVTVVQSLLNPEKERVHSQTFGPDGTAGTHLCYLIFPGELNPGTLEKPEIHYLDIEAGFLAGIIGLEAGVSLGETADFILGLFKFSEEWSIFDLANDDAEELRQDKRLWMTRRKKEGYPAPK